MDAMGYGSTRYGSEISGQVELWILSHLGLQYPSLDRTGGVGAECGIWKFAERWTTKYNTPQKSNMNTLNGGLVRESPKKYPEFRFRNYTPQKSNMDTKQLPCFKLAVTFSKAHHSLAHHSVSFRGCTFWGSQAVWYTLNIQTPPEVRYLDPQKTYPKHRTSGGIRLDV